MIISGGMVSGPQDEILDAGGGLELNTKKRKKPTPLL